MPELYHSGRYPRRRLRAAPLFATLCLATGLVACSPSEQPGRGAGSDTSESTPARENYSSYRRALEQRLALLSTQLTASAEARDVGPARRLFQGWLHHARLTGDLASYERAAQALAVLQERIGGNTPCRAQAELALASHRIDDAATALQACPDTDHRDLLVDIDFYQGHYERAIDLAVALLTEEVLPSHYVRLARLRQGTGSPREAEALLEAAERRYHNRDPHQQAWFKLQRGILALEGGEYERARALFRRADEVFPDWWLVQEHLAEVSLLLGDLDTAASLYDRVIEATDDPVFLAARAEVDRAAGDEQSAQERITRARAAMESRLAQFPEAAAGHAVDFFLQYGPAERALALARQDHALRPYGASTTRLAAALRLTGQAQAGLDVLEPAVAAGWDTARAQAELARLYRELGRSAESERASWRARWLNPQIDR